MSFFSLSSDVENSQDFIKIYDKWKKLAKNPDLPDNFCSGPIWNLSFHEAFSPDRSLYIAHDSNSLVAFAEKKFPDGRVFMTPIEASWNFGSHILGKHAIELLKDAIDAFSKKHEPVPVFILISGIVPNSLFAKRLLSQFQDIYVFYRYSHTIQCSANLENGLDGFLANRSANHRSKLKKAMKKAKNCGISFERHNPKNFEEADSIYARMLDIESRSWKGINHCGMLEYPVKDYYGIMLRRLSKMQEARVIFARHENRDIGFIFGGLLGSVYRGQQFSYDDNWKTWSIGNLLQLEKITWLCEEGISLYNMGPIVGPKMEYKQHWTEIFSDGETWMLKR